MKFIDERSQAFEILIREISSVGEISRQISSVYLKKGKNPHYMK